MANILLGEQNKELLWNILYSNKTFESIPQSKFNDVKTLFENAIIKVFNANLEKLESTTNVNAIKMLMTQLNKTILQNIIEDIANFNQIILTSTNVKANYKGETLESFEKQYKEKQVSFNEFMTKIEPPEVNFETIKEDTLETSELDKLLENIQKERLKDINATPISATPIAQNSIKEPISEKPEKPNKLELLDLNTFEKAIEEPPKKKKISTIEELLYDVQSETEKKNNVSVLVSIDNKLTLLMENQQKILEKLALLNVFS
jgi:hypothetical protein